MCGTKRSRWLGDSCSTCLLQIGMDESSDHGRGWATSDSLPRLGDYQLEEEIARGGMGVVYRARQLSLNRAVAVKVLLAGQFANAAFVARFRREAEAAASLNHPNIVSIHDVGEHEGRPFFSMQLVAGRSLAELVHEKPMEVREAAQLVRTIAEAVHFAHEHGVLHRDLKPSNVLVDSNGVPHVTDFGLAKRVERDSEKVESDCELRVEGNGRTGAVLNSQPKPLPTELTLTGQVLGSPNYMPPEQSDPKRGPVTRASDVYSLGAILYHALTGRPPFLADSVTQTLRLVADADPVAPRWLNPALSRDLETICLKCLEKEASRRYATARELADELARFLRDEPIRARPVGLLGRLRRWRRRKPALAASLSLAALLLLVLMIGSPVALIRINNARSHAEEARGRAESAERRAEARLYTALLEQARATVRSGEMGQRLRTLDAIRGAVAVSNTVELRREAVAALILPDLQFERELPTGPDASMAALDVPFERLAVGRGTNGVEIQSVPDQRVLARLPSNPSESAVAGRWSSDGRFLAVRKKQLWDALHRAEVWEVSTAKRILKLPPTTFGACAFHAGRAQVLADQGENILGLWNLDTGQLEKTFVATGIVHHVEFSPDGRSFLVHHRIGAPWFTSLYDTESGAVRRSALSGWIDGIAWDPHDRWVAFAARNGEIHLHDRRTEETIVLGRHKQEARSAAFTADGNLLFTGGDEREIICWDPRFRRRVLTIGPRSAYVQTARDNARCAVVTGNGVLLHSLVKPAAVRELDAPLGGSISHAAFSPDGRWLAAGGATQLGIWDLSGSSVDAQRWQAEQAKPVFSPDGTELLAFNDRAASRWRLRPAAGSNLLPELTPLPLPTSNRIYSADFVGKELIIGDKEGVLVVSDRGRSTNAAYAGFLGYADAKVSPDGVWLAAGKQAVVVPCRLRPWHVFESIGAGPDLFAHGFTPASDELVLATRLGLTFFDTHRWQPQRRLATPLDRNVRMIFTPDGRGLWLVRDARNAALHDLRTFEEWLPLPGHVTPLALSADGRQLAVEVDARWLQVWDLAVLRGELRKMNLDWADRR